MQKGKCCPLGVPPPGPSCWWVELLFLTAAGEQGNSVMWCGDYGKCMWVSLSPTLPCVWASHLERFFDVISCVSLVTEEDGNGLWRKRTSACEIKKMWRFGLCGREVLKQRKGEWRWLIDSWARTNAKHMSEHFLICVETTEMIDPSVFKWCHKKHFSSDLCC